MEHLGICENDLTILREEVDVILNGAASINFDDPLKIALNINYFGCKRMLALAKSCKKLQVFSHVSTAYANSDRPSGHIDERIYSENKRIETDFEK